MARYAANLAKPRLIAGRVLRGTLSNSAGRAIGLGTWFLLTPFIVHQLGPNEYGLWVLAGSVVAFSALLELGIGAAVTKYVAEHLARDELRQAREIVATGLSIYAALGFVTVTLGLATAMAFPHLFDLPPDERAEASWLVALMGLAAGVAIPSATGFAVLQGLQRYDVQNLIGTAGTLLSAMATVVVLLAGGGLLAMVAVNVPVTMLTFAASMVAIRRLAPELGFSWRGARRSLVRQIISFSAALFVSRLAGHMKTKSDEIVIALFLPLSAVTPYALARRLTRVAVIAAGQFAKVLLPVASQLQADEDQAQLRELYLTASRVTLAILLPIAAVLVILARPILVAWVGPMYADAAVLVVILSIAALIDTSQWPAGYVLQGIARHRPLAAISMAGALANIALSVALIGPLGVTGVAIGTLIPATAEALGLVLPYALRAIGVNLSDFVRQAVLRALLPAIPTAILLLVLRESMEPSSIGGLVTVVGIGLLAYVAAYLRFGASPVERETLRDLAADTRRFAGAQIRRITS